MQIYSMVSTVSLSFTVYQLNIILGFNSLSTEQMCDADRLQVSSTFLIYISSSVLATPEES